MAIADPLDGLFPKVIFRKNGFSVRQVHWSFHKSLSCARIQTL